jgi:hypothetical protein
MSANLKNLSFTCSHVVIHQLLHQAEMQKWAKINVPIGRGADKSLAFPVAYFTICSTTKRFFLGWVKEVRTMKS